MRKQMVLVLALIMIISATMFSGCGTAAPVASASTSASTEATATAAATKSAEESVAATPAAPAAVEIRVVWWGDTKRHELYNQICDAFTAENPNITLVREPVAWADYWDKLSVQSAGNGTPDFMGMHPQFANDYVRRGVLLPLDKFISDGVIDLSQFSKSSIDTGIMEGVDYMIPMGITGQSMFVNKTLLESLSIPLPSFDWTWDDIKTIGQQARTAFDAAGKKDTWLIDDNTGNLQLFRYWIRQEGRELYTASGDIGFTEEDASSWFTMWKDLRDNNLVPDAATTTEYTKATLEESLFVKSRIAIRGLPANQYKLYSIGLEGNELLINRNPSKAGKQVGEFMEGAHFAVSSSSTDDKKLAAAMLINFWVNSEKSYQFFGMDQGVPGNAKMAEYIKPNLDEYQLKAMDYVGKISLLTGIPVTYPPAGASEVSTLFTTIAEKVMFDALSPQDAAKQLQTEAQAVVDKNK